ncbi:MAG: reverse transcriptase domain-containing protein [Clostridium sp.]|uniref:reverse transcriptase domain-containing protein n=1 Tax=Clostridium sp. TaxID=1506 RepID=UPI003F3838DF
MLNSIKDKNGKERDIIILTEDDKDKRRYLKEKLEEYIKPEENVYSFVKGKSVKAAIEFIRENIDKYEYFFKVDIEKYFESMDRGKILEILDSYGVEYDILNKVGRVLEVEEEIMERKGIALGSPLSNYLANIYLKDMDKLFLERENLEYIRFCDDIFILSRNKNTLEEVIKQLEKYNLKLNESKSYLGSFGDSVVFLGENIEKKKNKLDGLVHRYIEKGESEETIVEELVEEFDFETIDEFLEKIKTEDGEEKEILNRFKMVDYFYESNNNGESEYKKRDVELSLGDIKEHLKGKKSIAISVLREDGRSNIGVIDIDENISGEVKNIDGYVEKTGGKGYHIWFFFKTFYKVDEIERYLEKIREEYFKELRVEIFPKKNYLEEKENIIKLPLGIHPKYLNESKFLNLEAIDEIKEIEIKVENERFESFLEEIKEEYEEGYKIIWLWEKSSI